MLSIKELGEVFLPALSHSVVWIIFLLIVFIVLVLYAYPYIKKSGKEFRGRHKGILVANIISLYIFTKMFEGVIYQMSILKVDAWFNGIVYSSWLTNAALFITAFGDAIAIALLFALALAVLLFRKRWRYALLSTIVILGALALRIIIKAFVSRVRPENLIETGFSFPSGHAIMAVAFVSLLIYSFKDDFKNGVMKYMLMALSLAFFIAVGISRIILHVHWFSDVVAGISLGLFWFTCVVLVERSIAGLIQAIRRETKKAE